MGKPRGPGFTVMRFSLLAKYFFAPQLAKSVDAFRQRIEKDIGDGLVFISPPIEVDQAEIISLTTKALSHDH